MVIKPWKLKGILAFTHKLHYAIINITYSQKWNKKPSKNIYIEYGLFFAIIY